MSRTDNTRPWKIRDCDSGDKYRYMSFAKKYERYHCEYCFKGYSRTKNSKRKAVKEQLDTTAE